MAVDVFAITIVTRDSSGQISENVVHYEMDSATFADYFAATKALVHAMRTVWQGAYCSLMSDIAAWIAVTGRRINNGGGATYVEQITDGQGTYTSDGHLMSTATAGVIRWVTGDVDHDGGHSFIPNVDVSAMQDNIWQPDYLTAIAGLLAITLPGLNVGTVVASLGVWSKKAHAFYAFAYGYLVPKPGSLNKRLKPFPQ